MRPSTDPLRRLKRRLFTRPTPEADVGLELISRYLPPRPVIVEAGAHIGYDTVRFAATWPEGAVHAFEPIPVLYAQLDEATRGLENVHAHCIALGERDGITTIHVSGGAVEAGRSDASSSLLAPKEHLRLHPQIRFDDALAVETVTLDTWRRRAGIDRVDFLWLDLQGFEPHVLAASPETLAGVSAIHTEVSLLEMYEGGWLYPQLRDWLAERGFAVAAERLPYPDMGNVLFVRREAID
jgi:FkbM family methyltransferase